MQIKLLLLTRYLRPHNASNITSSNHMIGNVKINKGGPLNYAHWSSNRINPLNRAIFNQMSKVTETSPIYSTNQMQNKSRRVLARVRAFGVDSVYLICVLSGWHCIVYHFYFTKQVLKNKKAWIVQRGAKYHGLNKADFISVGQHN